MGLFGKKKDKNVQNYNIENKLFPISRPWGYSPEHVETAVKNYIEVIEQQKQTINNLKEKLIFSDNERSKLENEMRNLHMQLNFVSAPSLNDIQEEHIQNQFNRQFKQSESRNKSSMIEDEMNSGESNFNPFMSKEDRGSLNQTDSVDDLFSQPDEDLEGEINEKDLQNANNFLNNSLNDDIEETTEGSIENIDEESYDIENTEDINDINEIIEEKPKHKSFKIKRKEPVFYKEENKESDSLEDLIDNEDEVYSANEDNLENFETPTDEKQNEEIDEDLIADEDLSHINGESFDDYERSLDNDSSEEHSNEEENSEDENKNQNNPPKDDDEFMDFLNNFSF